MLDRCKRCNFVKPYFFVVLLSAVTVRFLRGESAGINALAMLLIPLAVYRLTPKDIGFRNFKRGIIWGVSVSALILPVYCAACYWLNGSFNPKINVSYALAYLIFASIPEEVFFRGFMYASMENEAIVWKLTKANLITSFLFALAHVLIYYNPAMFRTFFPALVFGFIYERSGSLIAPIIFHWLSDVIYMLFPC